MPKIPEHILDDIRARLPVSLVVSRKVALKRAGREFKGLSPFQTEKTPSFFANDQKQRWFDYSAGEHGDIFDFLMLTEGLSFRDAVEALASEAGVSLPESEPERPEQRQLSDERTRLAEICTATLDYFVSELRRSNVDASEARAYLERRGVSRDTIERFRIGFAPDRRDGLKVELRRHGFTFEEMIKAGVLIGGDDIPVPYDRFRGRVMFPILSAKAVPISFGGRTIHANAKPKYLNGSDSPIFHKGRVLYNWSSARVAAFESKRIVVVEGYMDVVGMVQGGVHECVATLGTALNEDHLRMLWQVVERPIMFFDGDDAGRRAAYRALDLALLHVCAKRSLQFAFLPEGQDPDDLMRTSGFAAVDGVLAQAKSLVDVLWQRELTVADLSTPEGRAAFETRVYRVVSAIQDGPTRHHYNREMKDRLWKAMNPKRSTPVAAPLTIIGGRDPVRANFRSNAARWQPPVPSQELVMSLSDVPAGPAMMLSLVLLHPWLIVDCAEELAMVPLRSQPLAKLRDALVGMAGDGEPNVDDVSRRLGALGMMKLVGAIADATTEMRSLAWKFEGRDDVHAKFLAYVQTQTKLARKAS